MNNEVSINIRNQINQSVMYSLLGRATKKMRGITAELNKDNLLTIKMFFDNNLSEEEEEEMQIANTEVVADFFNDFKDIYLDLLVVHKSIDICDKKGNLGWFYLRKEY
ncbi:hypothetical protein A9G42_01010 [Gilliamella sp. Nev6-6]|jgi:hypothetical protein|uniref:hypothetical protein n=1 Tax=Gilliamella sp. Nev6-6 TaxID=3120252 RepID=UPI00080F45B0|nr:hypothetical protein [Gilliamella apicola]OCG77232.1 hypothetical protein A9G42_01010 [Gilliamella apicola]